MSTDEHSPLQSVPSAPPPKFMDMLQSNLLWFALSIIVATVSGTAGALLFLEGRVEKQVQLILPAKLFEAIKGETGLNDRRIAEKEAKDSHDAANRAETLARQEATLAHQQATDALRQATELKARIDQLNSAADLSKIGQQIDAAIKDPSFQAQVIARVLPVGAIVAFDLSSGCPEGWSAFDVAGGRVLLGAGPHKNLDASGRLLSTYKLGQFGGEENHILTIEEMPTHTHYAFRAIGNGDGLYPKAEVMGPPGQRINAPTQETGGSKPHNVLNPYVAVNFCKKAS